MSDAIKAEVTVGDRSPVAGAGGTLPLTQTPEGRLRVDAALSVADVEISGIGVGSGTFTSRSGSVTLGGTSQTLAAANTARKYLLIENPLTAAGQNVATAESLYVRFGASASGVDVGTSFEITPGGSLELTAADFVTTEAVQVNATTTNHRWIAVEA